MPLKKLLKLCALARLFPFDAAKVFILFSIKKGIELLACGQKRQG